MGGTATRFSEAASVRIGPFELDHTPVFIMPHGFFNLGAQGDAMLGYDALAEFVVRFDYKRGRAWLKHADPRRRLFGLDYASMREAGALLQPTDEGAFQVWGVAPDGAAAQRGVRPGDELSGGEPARALAASLAAGNEITVARQVGGAKVDVVLPPTGTSSSP